MPGRREMGRGRKETCWLKETRPTRQPRRGTSPADVGVHGIKGWSWRSIPPGANRTSRCLSKIARLKNDRIFPEGADGLVEAAPGTRPFSSLPSGLVVFAKHASSSINHCPKTAVIAVLSAHFPFRPPLIWRIVEFRCCGRLGSSRPSGVYVASWMTHLERPSREQTSVAQPGRPPRGRCSSCRSQSHSFAYRATSS